jgi:hypothetical protein
MDDRNEMRIVWQRKSSLPSTRLACHAGNSFDPNFHRQRIYARGRQALSQSGHILHADISYPSKPFYLKTEMLPSYDTSGRRVSELTLEESVPIVVPELSLPDTVVLDDFSLSNCE